MSDGNAGFLRAARDGNLDEVLDYLKGSTDINTSNPNGLNALHLASKEGHINIVTELLKRGANVEAATKKGNTALHIASLAGHEDIVKTLVDSGAQVNLQAQAGFTPLYMAAQEGHSEVVKYLLTSGANQGLSTEDGFTPLAVALQQGHDRVVSVLLEHDAKGKVRLPALHIAAKKDDVKSAALLLQNEQNSVEMQNKSGFTPLHIASHYGNTNVATLLIQRNADVNFKAKNNITPLHVGSRWGKLNMVTLLLDSNASIAEKTRDGLTPLHCAARSGHDSVVDTLLERGAPHSAKTKNGLTPLHMAAQGDHEDCARLLLYHKASLNEVTVDYLTPLHVAAHCGNVKTAKLLLDRKCEPNARALNGFTPLHIACKKNRIKVVELLLKYGASIESKTESGLTPLHVASFMGHMNIVIYLIQHNANPNTATVRGETSLHLAARANQSDIIRILLRNGATVDARAREQQTPLHIASRLGNVDNVVLLLQHGAQVDAVTKDKYTPMHIAAKEGHEEVAQVLLEHEAQHHITTKKGFTPLHISAKYGNIKGARLLLQKDANPDIQGKNGLTPLHVATHYNHPHVAQLLLEHKANPHAAAKNGYTPLHIAAKKNQMDIATMLLEYGARANAESKNGFTPLHLASQMGHTDIVSLLLQKDANVNATAHNGLTPMHLAAQEDKVAVAEILIKYGSESDTSTKAGYTPLHTACHFGQINMVRFLLEQNASVNATTKVGYTPLHQAAQQGAVQVVSTLLKHQASPNAVTNNGQTPLAIAQKLGYISVVEILRPVTEVSSAVAPASEDKYKVVSPETMQETFISDSEDEADDFLPQSPIFGKPLNEQHVYLPYYEGQKIQNREDSISRMSLERGGSASPLDQSFDKREESMIMEKSRQDSVFGDSTDYSTLGRDSVNFNFDPPKRESSMAGDSIGDMIGDVDLKGVAEDVMQKRDVTSDEMEKQEGRQTASTPKKRAPRPPKLQKQDSLDLEQLMSAQLAAELSSPALTAPREIEEVLEKQEVEVNQMASVPPMRPPRGIDSIDSGAVVTHSSEDSLVDADATEPPPVIDLKSPVKDYMDAQMTSQSFTSYSYSAPPPTRLPANTEANRYSSYSGSSFSTSFDPDNVPVDKSPVYAGKLKWKSFLISFMVDARGGAMRGSRHPSIRVIVPPKKCSMPTRVTCRLVKKEKLQKPPPMLEGEGLASRVLEMGPVGTKFLGPVLIEVPHYASLRGCEREVVILRSDNGETWYEHPMVATEENLQQCLGSSADELDSEEECNKKRIARILTSDLPQYFALVSRVTRVKQESTTIGQEGGVLSSNVVPKVQAVFPEGTLTRPIPVGLQAQPIAPELVAKLLGNRVAVSPIVTVEPRRRRFHKPITLTIPVPRAAQKGMINNYGGERPTLRLLYSLATDPNPAQWEDITDQKPITLVDDCVSFTTSVSARFWLIDCQNVQEAVQMASVLYQEAVTVPYMAKFVVFAKRDSPEEGRLRIFCMTDDKDDKTLEKLEKFHEVARSRDIEVLEGRPQFVEMAGNLIPVTKSGDQLHVNFRAFRENRLSCTVKIRDQDLDPTARVAFMKEPKVARGEAPQAPICNLNIRLPDNLASDSTGEIDPDKAAEVRKKQEFLRGQGLVIQDSVNRAELKLADIADTVQGDWVVLAQQLGLTISDINHIKGEYKTLSDQALAMLTLWVERQGERATGNELETALRRINRDDVVRKCMSNVGRVGEDEVEAAAQRVAMEESGFDTFSEEVGVSSQVTTQTVNISKDSLKRGMSLDVQYDEQDMVKESESATEESPTEERSILARVPEVQEPSLDHDLVRATIDPRRNIAKTTKSKEEQELEAKKKKEAYLALAMQMDELADSIDARRPPKHIDTSDRSSVQEENIVRQSKASAEALPALRGVQVSSEPPLNSQPPQQQTIPLKCSDEFQQKEDEHKKQVETTEETFVAVSETQQHQVVLPSYNEEDEEIISVSQQESPEGDNLASPLTSKPHVSFAESPIVIEAYEEQISPEEYREEAKQIQIEDDFDAEEARLVQEEAEFAQLQKSTVVEDTIFISENQKTAMASEIQQEVSEIKQDISAAAVSQSEEVTSRSSSLSDSGDSMIIVEQEEAAEGSPVEQVTDLDEEEEVVTSAQDLIQGKEFVSQELLELVSQSQQQEEETASSTLSRNQEIISQIQSKFIPLDVDDEQIKVSEHGVTVATEEAIPKEVTDVVETTIVTKEESLIKEDVAVTQQSTTIITQHEQVATMISEDRELTPSVESVSNSQDVSYEDVTATSQDYVNLLNSDITEVTDEVSDVTSMDYEEQNRKLTFRQVSEEAEVEEQQRSKAQVESFIAEEVKSQLDASQDEIATVMTQLNTSQEEIIAGQQMTQMNTSQEETTDGQQMTQLNTSQEGIIAGQQMTQMNTSQEEIIAGQQTTQMNTSQEEIIAGQQQEVEEYDNLTQMTDILTQSQVSVMQSQPKEQQQQDVIDDQVEQYNNIQQQEDQSVTTTVQSLQEQTTTTITTTTTTSKSVKFADETITRAEEEEITRRAAEEVSQTPPPSPSDKSEEPVLASETESSMKEVATRLASEQAEDFDSVFDDNAVNDSAYNKETQQDGTVVRQRSLSSTSSPVTRGDLELVEEIIQPPKEEIETINEFENILDDGTVHKLQHVRQRSLKQITKTWRSIDGEEIVEEEQEEVPGTLKETKLETFKEPAKSVRQEEDFDHELEDGSKIKRKLVTHRLIHHTRGHQESFDSDSGRQVEKIQFDEVVPGTETAFVEGGEDEDSDSDYYYEEYDSNEESKNNSVGQGSHSPSPGDRSPSPIIDPKASNSGDDSGAVGDDEEIETHRLMMKKEVHKKTTLGPDGKETTTVHQDSQIQQENEPPEELRDSMQEIINQFMESDPQPAQLPPSESKEEEV